MNELEIDARLTIIESLLAAVLQRLIEAALLEPTLVSSLLRELPNVQSAQWAGMPHQEAAAAAKARSDALQRFLILLR
jgi:hypothetical protein